MRQIPIIDSPNQQSSVTINNRRVTLRIRFNPTVNRWFFDLALDGEFVLHGRKIVNNINLIRQYGFGIGAIVAYSESDVEPNRDNLINGSIRILSITDGDLNAAV